MLLIIAIGVFLCGCGALSPKRADDTTSTWQEQYDLGVRYLSEGNYEEAILAFSAAIEIDPMRSEAYIGLADAYVGQGEYDKALEILGAEAVSEQPEIKEKIDEIKALIEANIQAYKWCYQRMKEQDYESIYMSGNVKHEKEPESIWHFRYCNGYSGMCYDGSEIVRGITGEGMTVLAVEPVCYIYLGDLENGQPSGSGVCVSMMYWGGAITEDTLSSYRMYEGEWSGGKPNGYGVCTQFGINSADQRCITIDEGNWEDGLANGTFTEAYYVDGEQTDFVQLTCDHGTIQSQSDGGKHIAPEFLSENELELK